MIDNSPGVVGSERGIDGLLLAFLAPGLLHSLGNQLFAIQGCAHLLKDGPAGKRQRATILEATSTAGQAVEIVRLLIAVDRQDDFEQAGVLLSRLTPLCRVSLRERGLDLELGHSSARRPRSVDSRLFARLVLDMLRRLADHLPAFVQGRVRIDLSDQNANDVTIDLSIALEPSCLPFPIDLGAVGLELGHAHHRDGVEVDTQEIGRLRVRIPSKR